MIIPDYTPFDVSLPGNMAAYVDLLQPKHASDAARIWRSATSSGDGFAVNETETEDTLLAYNNMGNDAYAHVIIDKQTEAIIAVNVTIPSGMCRSSKPFYGGGYLVVNKSYRGGTGTFFFQLSRALQAKRYKGGLHRSNILSRGLKANKVSKYAIMPIHIMLYVEARQLTWKEFLISYFYQRVMF